MSKVQADGFAKAVEDVLTSFGGDVQEATLSAVNETATGALRAVRAKAKTYGWKGEYTKSLKARKASVESYNVSAFVYAQAPHYSLVHLLEKGHKAVDGSFVAARPHFDAGQEYVDDNFEKILTEKITE